MKAKGQNNLILLKYFPLLSNLNWYFTRVVQQTVFWQDFFSFNFFQCNFSYQIELVHEGKAPNIYDSIALGSMRGEENRIPEGVNECQRKTVAPALRIRMHTRTRARFARGQTRKLKHQNNLFQHIRVL